MIKQCEACFIDFEAESNRARFCKVRACVSDRQADQNQRHYAKLLATEPAKAKCAVYGKEYAPRAYTRVARNGTQRKTHRGEDQ